MSLVHQFIQKLVTATCLEIQVSIQYSFSLSTERVLYILGDKMVKNAESRIFQIFLVLLLFSQLSNVAAAAAPAEQWNRSFGGDGEDISWCVQQTSDSGYVAAGVKNGNAWLVKLAGNGESIKHKEKPFKGYGRTEKYTYDIFHWIFQWDHFK